MTFFMYLHFPAWPACTQTYLYTIKCYHITLLASSHHHPVPPTLPQPPSCQMGPKPKPNILVTQTPGLQHGPATPTMTRTKDANGAGGGVKVRRVQSSAIAPLFFSFLPPF